MKPFCYFVATCFEVHYSRTFYELGVLVSFLYFDFITTLIAPCLCVLSERPAGASRIRPSRVFPVHTFLGFVSGIDWVQHSQSSPPFIEVCLLTRSRCPRRETKTFKGAPLTGTRTLDHASLGTLLAPAKPPRRSMELVGLVDFCTRKIRCLVAGRQTCAWGYITPQPCSCSVELCILSLSSTSAHVALCYHGV